MNKQQSSFVKKQVLPIYNRNITTLKKKVKDIDRYKKRILLTNKVRDRLMRHILLLVERRHLKFCTMLVFQKDDFESIERFRQKLQLILYFKKKEFSSFSNQVNQINQERRVVKKQIVETIKSISALRQKMCCKHIRFQTELKTILTEHKNILLLNQLHEIKISDGNTGNNNYNTSNNNRRTTKNKNKVKQLNNKVRALIDQQEYKKMRMEINLKLSKKYNYLIAKEENECNKEIADMRNKLIEKSENLLEIMSHKLQMEYSAKLESRGGNLTSHKSDKAFRQEHFATRV